MATDVAVQPNGQIVAAAWNDNWDFNLARYNADGTLDTSFGTAGTGVVTTQMSYIGTGRHGGHQNLPVLSAGYSIAVQADGQIVAGGTAEDYANGGYDFALQRYTAAGELDTSFGTAGTGIVTTDVSGGAVAEAFSVAVQPDGDIVAAGCDPNSDASGSVYLARYMPGKIGQTVTVKEPSLCVWDGDGPDNLLSDPDNWVGAVAPIPGDQLQFTGSGRTVENDFAAGTTFRSLEFAAPGFTLSGDALAVTGGITVDSGVGGTTTVSAAITGSGTLVQDGDGTLVVSGNNSFSGGVTITAGATLQVANDGAVPSGAGMGNLEVDGRLDLDGYDASVNELTGAGTVTTTASGLANLTVNADGPDTFAGVIQDGSGTVGVVMNGSGTLTYGGICTYTGGTTVNAGSVGVEPGVGSMVCVWNGGDDGYTWSDGGNWDVPPVAGDSLSFASPAWVGSYQTYNDFPAGTHFRSITIGAGSYQFTGAGVAVDSISLASGCDLAWNGLPVTIDDSAGGGDSLTVDVPVDSQLVFTDLPSAYNCVVSGTGSLVKTGLGTLWLTGADTYDGPTIVANGTLALGAYSQSGVTANELPTTTTVTLGDAAANTSGVLELFNNQAIAGLQTAGTGTGNAVVGGSSAISTLTIENDADDTFAGALCRRRPCRLSPVFPGCDNGSRPG